MKKLRFKALRFEHDQKYAERIVAQCELDAVKARRCPPEVVDYHEKVVAAKTAELELIDRELKPLAREHEKEVNVRLLVAGLIIAVAAILVQWLSSR
jgi:hypothetical protein